MMNPLIHYMLLSLIPATIILHLIVSPYTKVEESFNIQAIHDILEHGIPFSRVAERLAANYDHVTFSGSVPRTFVGALVLSALAKPFVWLCADGKQLQILVRGILGLINAFSLLSLQQAVSQAFGQTAGYWYIILQASQFHVMYYASRTIPNFLAFPLTTLSLRNLILSHFGSKQKKARRCQISLGLLTVAGVIFRSELALLLAHMILVFMFSMRLSLRDTIIPVGLTSALGSLLISVPIDSFFWQKFPLWPEFDALLYNTIEGKSSEWGISPWHYYFTDSIPKLMINPMSLLLCLPVALLLKPTRRFMIDMIYPLLAFAAMYSFLPHKEWRFIAYIIPGLTAGVSAGAAWIWTRRNKSGLYKLLNLVLIGSVIGSLISSIVLLSISSLNYPGGDALFKLKSLEDNLSGPLRVHLDNLSCQSGVTRFLQNRAALSTGPIWHFDKTEDSELLLQRDFWTQFDYVLSETPDDLSVCDKGYLLEGSCALVSSAILTRTYARSWIKLRGVWLKDSLAVAGRE